MVRMSNIDEINIISSYLPVLYYKINSTNIVVDCIVGNLPVYNESIRENIGEDITENCPNFLRDYIADGINEVRKKGTFFEVMHVGILEDQFCHYNIKFIPFEQEYVIILIQFYQLTDKLDILTIDQLRRNGVTDICRDMFWIIDIAKCLVYEANEAFLNYFNIEKEVLLKGFDVMELIDPNYKIILESIVSNIKENKVIKNVVVEINYGEKHGFIESNCMGIYEQGQLKYILCVSKDVEAINQKDQMKEIFIENMRLINEIVEYDRVRTEFFSNVSHEFKTPINVIMGALKLMEMHIDKINEKDIVDKMTRLHNSMHINSYRLLRLVSNLLDITKIDSGYIKINYMNCDIVHLARSITMSIHEYAIERHVKLKFHTDLEEKIIACDPEKIERILLNLLSNAIKFTNQGDTIIASIKTVGNEVILSVKDSGIGIKEENQDKIFARFKQVDKQYNLNNEGTGIGLSLVKSLVEMHHGRVWFTSEYGVGTEFFFTLPDKLVQEEADYYKGYDNMNVGKSTVMEFSDIYGA